MMEPCGGTISIVSPGLSICEGLKEYYASWKTIDPEVDSTLASIATVQKVLSHLDSRLSSPHAESTITKGLQNALQECTEPLERLRKKLDKIRQTPAPRPGRHSSISEKLEKQTRKALYPFRSSTLAKLKEIVAEISQKLQLALGTIHVDTAAQQIVRLDEITAGLAVLSKNVAESRIKNDSKNWLSPPDPSPNFEAAQKKRQSGTGEWLLRCSEFETWKQHKRSILWLHGNAGCGKTILCSTAIVATMIATAHEINHAVLYYFYDFNDPDKRTPGNMLRSFIWQLACQSEAAADILDSLRKECKSGMRQPSMTQLLYAFNKMTEIELANQIYVCCDALDECEDVDGLFEILTTINNWSTDTIHMLFTSRHERQISEAFTELDPITISIQQSAVDADIRKHVHSQLVSDRWWQKWDPKVKEEVISTLCRNSNGMFRWVVCQLDALKRCLNIAMLRDRLYSLPKTLEATYARILDNIDEYHYDYALRILRFLCYARRPMTIEEIAEIAAVGPDGYDETLRFVDPTDIQTICSSLISTSGPWVQLAHFSVREYLTSGRAIGRTAVFNFSTAQSELFIAATCINYMMRFSQPDLITWETRKEFHFANYSACYWASHLSFGAILSDQSQKKKSELLKKRVPALSAIEGEHGEDSLSLEDVVQLACQMILQPECFRTLNLLVLVDSPYNASHMRHWVIFWNLSPVSPMYYLSKMGSFSVAGRLIDVHGCSMNDEPFGVSGSPFYAAFTCETPDMLNMFLEKGVDFAEQRALNHIYVRRSVLSLAALTRDPQFVNPILAHTDLFTNGGAEDMVEAIQELIDDKVRGTGYIDVVHLILIKSCDHSVELFEALALPVLAEAAAELDRGVLEMLIEFGRRFNINWRDIDGRTALMISCEVHDSDSFVSFLLDSGANPVLTDFEKNTALHLACLRSQPRVVEILLEANTEVNAKNAYDRTPLHLMVDKLLFYKLHDYVWETSGQPWGAEAFTLYTDEPSELSFDEDEDDTSEYADGADTASNKSEEETHNTTSDGEKTDSVDDQIGLGITSYSYSDGSETDGKSARSSSSESGVPHASSSHASSIAFSELQEDDGSIIESLLKKGANPNIRFGSTNTPLVLIALFGNIEIAQLLLDHGADANLVGELGCPPIHLASLRKDHEMIDLLLKHGANPSDQVAHDHHVSDYKLKTTVLHQAAEIGDTISIALIAPICELEMLNAGNVEGETPLEIAVRNKHNLIAKMLLEAMGLTYNELGVLKRSQTLGPIQGSKLSLAWDSSTAVESDLASSSTTINMLTTRMMTL